MRLLFLALLLAGCAPQPYEPQEQMECPLPAEYAIRSICPFATANVEGKCVIVCYEAFHDPNPDISKSYVKQCSEDDECACTYNGSDVDRCGCVNGMCAAVIG